MAVIGEKEFVKVKKFTSCICFSISWFSISRLFKNHKKRKNEFGRIWKAEHEMKVFRNADTRLSSQFGQRTSHPILGTRTQLNSFHYGPVYPLLGLPRSCPNYLVQFKGHAKWELTGKCGRDVGHTFAYNMIASRSHRIKLSPQMHRVARLNQLSRVTFLTIF